ncbi:hypothetical protein HPB49_017405 [Dermacentor silvarum]|uniref:Uncharacterized protein n=1 Tax=Dermacentor silvarum TaxID=543639 RepID=A0ACB8CG80_DERSI|nr:hypothetical protein HPB49_017405 [Dermacentor silvarum]
MVFLRDWTQLDEDIFKDVLEELPLEERVFIVAEVIPPIPVDQAVPGSSGLDDLVETFHSANTQFKLEIDRLPVSVQTALEANGPLPPRERRELVRSTVDQLTKFCSRPRRELIKSVASAIVLKFPSALQDKAIGGHLLGRGYDSLFQQLENRVENIYRGKQPASPSNERKHQRSKKWSYGCIDWQPRRNLEHPQDIEEKINFLKQEGRKSLKDVNAVFEENMAACAPLLHKHLAPVLKKDTMYLIFQVEEQQKRGNAKASEEALMPLLCAYFKENERQLFQVFEEGTSITEKLEELPLTPTVIALGSIFSKQCFVTCDHEVLFSQALSFTEATCLMFLCYYVFNITYAEEGSTTLEFLQSADDRFGVKTGPSIVAAANGERGQRSNLSRGEGCQTPCVAVWTSAAKKRKIDLEAWVQFNKNDNSENTGFTALE